MCNLSIHGLFQTPGLHTGFGLNLKHGLHKSHVLQKLCFTQTHCFTQKQCSCLACASAVCGLQDSSVMVAGGTRRRMLNIFGKDKKCIPSTAESSFSPLN
jgi:hypothetical protein